MKHKCYTFGYQGQDLQKLVQTVQKMDALLVDVRFRPFSRNAQWNKKNLQALLGENYLHIPELGNINYQGGPIQLVDKKKGCELVLEHLQTQDVILMCVCPCIESCHRNVIAKGLKKLISGLAIDNLGL